MATVRPNLHTIALAAMVLTMWYAGAAQQNGGAYLLAFLTGSIVMVSWLHAKANLRALTISAGSIRTAREGGRVLLPLSLVLGDGRVPCGLEITAVGAEESVFVESLAHDHPTHVELRVPAPESGSHTSFTVIARSYYPLGFFTAERVMVVAQPHLVHPHAAGDMPLPVASAPRDDADEQAGSSGMAGEGTDFAGVREWQAGDSVRHIDWKAVARGRPLMVKLWSGGSSAVVWLNWQDLADLPHEARLGQCAAWIEQAETQGLRYGLRLPQAVIEPGHGPDHRRQCLDALALMTSESGSQAGLVASASPHSTPTRETSVDIPGRPLALMSGGLALSVLPMIGNVPWAGVIVFYLALALQWTRQRRGRGPASQLWRLLAVAGGVGGTWLQARTLTGLEPGVSIMLAVTAGKILEARNARDLQIVALLGWFLCLCALALDQALGRSLFVFGVFALIAATLVRFRRGSAGMKIPLRVTSTLLAQALPFVLVLFFLFPRGTGGMVMRLTRQLVHHTGISASLDPGSIAEVAQSPALAFRAKFVEGPPPDLAERYWRCLVLWRCDGLRWQRGGGRFLPSTILPGHEGEVHQRITMEPHGDNWLPALDMPVHVMSHTDQHQLIGADGTLRSDNEISGLRTYEVGSLKEPKYQIQLAEGQRNAALQVPSLSPQVEALAKSFMAKGKVDHQIANAALNYFRTQGFRYTLEPEKYGEHALDEFLFDRRQGFCEHFAASFATLMRRCGVPSRVVIGYLGGEPSLNGDYYLVRQSDAHAWCELWYQGKGWTRVDPTAALAPGRLTSDLRTYLEGGLESAFARSRNTWWGRAVTDAVLFWDSVNYQWYSRVVQFDEDEQSSLFSSWKLSRYRIRTLIIGALVVFITPLVLLWFWIQRKGRHPDPAVRVWQAFCRKLAKAGIARHASEPPLRFVQRAATLLPNAAAQIQRVGELYVQLRYAENRALFAEFKRCARAHIHGGVHGRSS